MPVSDEALQRRALWVTAAVFGALSLVFGVVAEGFLLGDSCTHYLMARAAFDEPRFFFHVWGRPVCTGLYAVPALLAGRAGVRVLSTFIALGIAWLTARVARGQQQRAPVLAFMFVLGQPLVFLHSFSELTELPFALLMAVALLAYQRRWWVVFALAAALSPASRPEGFGVLLLAAAALVLHRSWAVLLLPLPLLGWTLGGALVTHFEGPWWRWLPQNWPYSVQSAYTAGSPFKFLLLLPVVTSPLAIFPTVLGWWATWRAAFAENLRGLWGEDPDAHRRRVALVIAGFPLGVLVVHSLLYWKGKMASNGELRYLLVATPMWALLASAGCEWFLARFSLRKVLFAAAAALLLPLATPRFHSFVPYRWEADWREARDFAQWYQTTPARARYPRLMNSHVGVEYFLGGALAVPAGLRWTQTNVARNPPGTMALWNSTYGPTNADAEMAVTPAQLLDAGWVEQPWPAGDVRRLDDGSPTWRLYFSAQPADGDGGTFR